MAFSNTDTSAVRSMEPQAGPASQIPYHLRVNPAAIVESAKRLESSLQKALAHPSSVSAALYPSSRPASPSTSPEDLEAAQTILDFCRNSNHDSRAAHGADTTKAATRNSPSANVEADSPSINDDDATESDSAPPMAIGSYSSASSSISSADVPTNPTFNLSMTPPTPTPNYSKKPITGKGSIVGESLDELIWMEERRWRGRGSAKSRAKSGSKKKPGMPREKNPSAADVQPDVPMAGNESHLALPVEKKRRRGAPKAKAGEKGVEGGVPLEERGENEGTTIGGGADVEERGGRPKRARKAPRRLSESIDV